MESGDRAGGKAAFEKAVAINAHFGRALSNLAKVSLDEKDYARALDEARRSLAIEPLHPMYAADRACVNTMSHANDLCDELGGGLGIAVDVYHVWWDPQLPREIQRAGGHSGRLMAYHICDWLVPTKDMLLAPPLSAFSAKPPV